MKTLSNTNMAASRLIKAHFRLMCVVQAALLKLPYNASFTLFAKTKPQLRANKYVSQALNAITNDKNKLLKTVRLASF